MAQKEYLKMADVPDFPGFETHRDIDYLKSTPGSWSEDYRRVFKSEQAAKRNTTRMFVYSKQLLGLLIQSIDQTNELVADVERLRGALSASMSALYEVERVTSELIKNGCYVVDDINAEVSYSIKLVEAIEE